MVVGLIVFILLAALGGGLVFLLGRRVGTFVTEKVLEPRRVAEEFVDAAARNDIARLEELSDMSIVSTSELEDFANFVSSTCGTVRSKNLSNFNVDVRSNVQRYDVEIRVACSRTDFELDLTLEAKQGSSPLVVSATWETLDTSTP